MIETTGDIFDVAFQCEVPNILLISTNGCWTKRDGQAILGAGIAKAAKELFPDAAKTLGTFLKVHYGRFKNIYENSLDVDTVEPWNIPYKIGMKNQTHVFSFPTKATSILVTKTSVLPRYFSQSQLGTRIEGWKGFSQLALIERSAKFITGIVGKEPSLIERVFFPCVGCGEGRLSWIQVKEILDKYWDDRYILVERVF